MVTDADHHFLFLNPMAENFVTDIKESGSYCGDGEIYEFLKGSQGFLTGITGIIRLRRLH